jgi:hypothetical protein
MTQTLFMIVACKNASGEPDLFRCEVVADPAEGDHYSEAERRAEESGFLHPMVAADESDALYRYFRN